MAADRTEGRSERSEAQQRIDQILRDRYKRSLKLKGERMKAGKREARRDQNKYRAAIGLPLLPEL